MKTQKTTRTNLRPVTTIELERLRDLYASAPLASTEHTATVDAALKSKGWIEIVANDFDGNPDAVMSKAAYRADGSACLYLDNGTVAPCWRAETIYN